MGKKRERLEVIHDILAAIRDAKNNIKPTRLLYSSNLSPQMFRDYMEELRQKEFLEEVAQEEKRYFRLTQKGFEFLEQYKQIVQFIDNFGL